MSKMFGSSPPPPEPEPVAPIPDDELSRIEKERDYQRRYGGKGRSGTVLTNSSGSLG